MTALASGEPATTAPRAAPVRLDLPARPDSLAVARQALTGIAGVLRLDDAVLDDVKLAVTEACTNVISHAYPDGAGRMELHVWADDGRLVVLVRDRGRGLTTPPRDGGSGLGLRLIAALAADVTVTSDPGGGTDVRMSFASY